MGTECDDAAAQADADRRCEWLPFEFRYKPGNVARAPPWVAPHQPRLDWQMWFAALDYDWQASAWFPALLQKLARNESDVVDLVGVHGVPFARRLPNYIRVRKLLYDFTVRYETTAVVYEAPKGTATDLERRCSQLKTRDECLREAKHCQFDEAPGGGGSSGIGGGRCANRKTVQHKLVTESSPDWWARRDGAIYAPALPLSEFAAKGYLPAGDSLPNMPITFPPVVDDGTHPVAPGSDGLAGGAGAAPPPAAGAAAAPSSSAAARAATATPGGGKWDGAALGAACAAACGKYAECLAYTYQPSRGVCYLKSVSSPVRGADCQTDCWYYGVDQGHVRAAHAHMPPTQRYSIAVAFAVGAATLLVAQAPLLADLMPRLTDLRDPERREVLVRQARILLPGAAALAAVLAGVYYTAHHLGQVFIPYLLAGGTGLLLSTYLYHVETALESAAAAGGGGPGSYRPFFDVGERISCSRVALSRRGRLLRAVPNSLAGIGYYGALIGLAMAFELAPDAYWLLLAAGAAEAVAAAAAAYQAYVCAAVLRAACPVCAALWVVSAALAALGAYIARMQRAFLEYDEAFLDAMAAAPKRTHGDYNPHLQHDLWTS